VFDTVCLLPRAAHTVKSSLSCLVTCIAKKKNNYIDHSKWMHLMTTNYLEQA
jgi:hypothetical protein